MNIKEEFPPIAHVGEWVGLDTELWGMDENLLHRPTTGRFGCLTVCLQRDPETVYITQDVTHIPRYLANINLGVWVAHHARFDLTQLRRWAHVPPRSKLWDTMLIEQIMYGGYYAKTEFKLSHLARRYLGIKMDKDIRDTFSIDKLQPMDDEQIQYACLDTKVTLEISQLQKRDISRNDFNVIWRQVELPFMFALMDFRGFRVDKDGWIEMTTLYTEKANRLEEEFEELTGIKINSHTKVRNYLASKGFRNIPNAQEATIEKFVEKYPDVEATEIGKLILDYKTVATNASRYGLSWIEKYAEKESDGVWVVFGDYHQIGAETGRTACSDPNMQNEPKNNEYRGKFIARPGNMLIICDWSQQEPGVSAFLSKDVNLLKANHAGDDIYVEIANLFYNKTIDKSDPLRKVMKAIYLGLSYGLGKYGLAKNLNLTVTQAEALVRRFRNVFNGYARWAKRQAKEKKSVRTVLGRKIWLNPYSSQCPRNALNGPHQGTGSDMMKLAINRIHTEWDDEVVKKIGCDYRYSIVAEVHDEFVLDVPELYAEEIAEWVKKVSIETAETMCPGVKFRVGIETGYNWSAKE